MKKKLLALVLIGLAAGIAFGQGNDTVLTVGTAPYLSIASATATACQPGAAGRWQILIPAGATPTDDPATVRGCARAYITDQRQTPNVTCQWNAPSYVCTTGIKPTPTPTPTPTGGANSSGTKPALATWLQGLHGCATRVVNATFITDSRGGAVQIAGSGGGPSNTANRYIDRFRSLVNTVCPSHGTGVVPVLSAADPGNPSPADPQFWTISGSWVRDATYGPSWKFPASSSATGMVASLANGTVATFTPGLLSDRLRVYYFMAAGSSIAVSVSNGTTATITGAGAGLPAVWDSGKFTAAGFVTSTLTCTGTCGVYAAEAPLGTVGATVTRLSAASAPSLHYSAANAFAFLDLIPSQLLVTDFGTNDANPAFGVSSAQYAAGMTTILSHELGLATPPSILVIEPPQSSLGAALPSYLTALQAIPLASSVSFLNFGDEFGPYNAAAGLFLPDAVHPGDVGSALESSMLNAALIDSLYRIPVAYGSPPTLGPVQTGVIGTGGTQALFAPGVKPTTDARFSVNIGTGSSPTAGEAMIVHLANPNSFVSDQSTYPSCGQPGPLTAAAATTPMYLGYDAAGGNIILWFSVAPPANASLIYDVRCDNGKVY